MYAPESAKMATATLTPRSSNFIPQSRFMSAFAELLSVSFPSFARLEQAAQDAAKKDSFALIKKNTEFAQDRVITGGSFRCYKNGQRKEEGRGSAKTNCPFHAWFRRNPTTGLYFFTKNNNMEHNHTLDPGSTTMSAVARRFVPTQQELIEEMHALRVPVPLILAELSKTTDVIFTNNDVYNHLQRSQRIEVDSLSDVQKLLQAVKGNNDIVYQVGKGSENRLAWFTFGSSKTLEDFTSFNFVLLMDSTYKTNRFNMPLLLISSVNPFGRTYVVACCMMRLFYRINMHCNPLLIYSNHQSRRWTQSLRIKTPP